MLRRKNNPNGFENWLDTPYPTNDVWSSMRLVRKEGRSAKPPVRPAEEKTEKYL
ncbi:MAG: hypothetical protein Ct9H300mP23_11630 [Nitrospinota bacterium]|nr:MAG: hypothetical protein Ct9H300mP23_11630 [Nitrospinota bacterium]